jgi:hypothetical protein
MAKASTIQTSFNAGELSPTLEGRVDLSKYANGCAAMENFIPLVQGGARKRSGTRFVNEVKSSANVTRLIPFEFGTTQAYILEFGASYMRVYKDGGQVLAAPIPPATEATIPYEISTPYLAGTLDSIQYAQSADVLYIAHPDWNPRKLVRLADDNWTLTIIDFDHAPFEPSNLDTDVTVYASSATGTPLLTSNTPLFTSDMLHGDFKISEIIGSHHRPWEAGDDGKRYGGAVWATGMTAHFEGNVYELTDKGSATKTGTAAPIHDVGEESDGNFGWTYLHSGSGYAIITSAPAIGAPPVTTASCILVTGKRFPDSAVGAIGATHRWAHGAWTNRNGFPRTVSFFEDRLWWAGTVGNPQTLWASKTGHYESHQLVDLDESAMIFTINTDQVNVIEWINAGKALTIGTAGGEFICSAALEGEALTPGNVRIVRHSTYGSKTKVAPVRVEQVLLFVQRAGRKLRELVFDDAVNSYVAPDMTILADHITLGGITRLAFQQEPNRLLWATLATGDLICFTYERSQQVTAWHRHTLGGTDAKVESIAVIPHPDGDQDQLWLVVSRTIGGATKRFVEVMEPEWRRTNAVASAFFVDSGLSYSGVSVSSVTGLEHLNGQTVSILADGATHPDKVVASGTVTLDRAATEIHIGLPYSATLTTMRLEAGASDGTAQGKTKRFTNVVIRLDQTGAGLLYGPTAVTADMDELHLRDSFDPMSTALPLFDGDTEILPWPEGYEQLGRLTLKHALPLPCTITAIMPQVNTQDR